MKRSLASLLGMTLGAVGVAAWQAPERVDTAAIAKMRDEGLNRSQVGAYFTMLVDAIGPRTDHLAFIAQGVPGFNPIQDYVDYDVREHHTNADTAERIKVDDLKQDAIILASVVYHAAMRTEQIPSAVRK